MITNLCYTSTPRKDQNHTEHSHTKLISKTDLLSSDNPVYSVNLTHHKINNCDKPITISDSNDIKIYEQTKGIIPKYISPLDNLSRYSITFSAMVAQFNIDNKCNDYKIE